MANPHLSINFQDVLDPRFEAIMEGVFDQLPDMIPMLYDMPESNGREDMRWSDIGALGNFPEFSGTIDFDSQTQGFDTISTPKEFASGLQIERKLMDDKQFAVMDARATALSEAAQRTRQVHGARIFNLAFSNDSFFYVNSENVALCSDSHTTNTSASTANGFDNLSTAAFSAAELALIRIKMVNFRDDRANRIPVTPDTILYPPNLYQQVHEVVRSISRPDNANDASNVHRDAYRMIEWNYLTDTNNFFVMDSRLMMRFLKWVDRIPLEFGMIEDFESFTLKWRAYMRYSNAWLNWRFVNGSQVS